MVTIEQVTEVRDDGLVMTNMGGPYRCLGNQLLAAGDTITIMDGYVLGWRRPFSQPPVTVASKYILYAENTNDGTAYIEIDRYYAEYSNTLIEIPADDPGDTGTWSLITMAYSETRVSTVWIAYGDDNSAPVRFKIVTLGAEDVDLTVTCVNLRSADSYIDDAGVLHWVIFDCSTAAGAPNCDFRYFEEDTLVDTISHDIAALYTGTCRGLAIDYAQEIGLTAYQTSTPPPTYQFRVPDDAYWTAESGRISPAYSLYGPYCLWTAQATIRVLVSARIYVDTSPDGTAWTTWIPGWAYVERYYLVGANEIFRHRRYNQRLQTFAFFAVDYPSAELTNYAVDYSESVTEDGVTLVRDYSGLSSNCVFTIGTAQITPNPAINDSGFWHNVAFGKIDDNFILIERAGSWDSINQVMYHRGWSVNLSTFAVSDISVSYYGNIISTRLKLREPL